MERLRSGLLPVSLAAFFLGIAIQESMLALLVLVQMLAALSSRQGSGTVFGQGRYGALLLALVLLPTAALAQYLNPQWGPARIHWALIAFWALSPALARATRWSLLHRVMLVVSLPGLILATLAFIQIAPQTFSSGLVAGWATYTEGLVVLACWSFFRLSRVRGWEYSLLALHLLLTALLVVYRGVGAGLLMLTLLLILGHALDPARQRRQWVIRTVLAMILVFGFWQRPPTAPMISHTFSASLALAGDHLLWGIGPNRFSSAHPERPQNPQNTLMGLLVESGIPGLVAFLIFMATLGLQLHRARKQLAGQEIFWVVDALGMVYLCFWVFGFFHYNFADAELLILHAYHWAAITCLAALYQKE